ncbi:lysophospholipid acyltransferase family protein [Acidisoma sp. C75]
MARKEPSRREPVPLDGAWPRLPRLPGGLRVAGRLASCLVWTLFCAGFQAVFLALPGRAKVVMPQLYWAGLCRCLGLSVRLTGAPMARGLPIVFISNHSSWMDIPALGARLPACFIAKGEVGRWPIISMVARLGRTIFVTRRAATAAQEAAEIKRRLAVGDNLVLFPEGTTSDGARVLPFRSSLLAVAEAGPPLLLQPVTIVYDGYESLPVRREDRALFAWFGDMSLAGHFNRIARCHRLRVTIMLHPPIDPRGAGGRKRITQRAWVEIAGSAAELRRNREAARAGV